MPIRSVATRCHGRLFEKTKELEQILIPDPVRIHQLDRKTVRKLSKLSVDHTWEQIGGQAIRELFNDDFLPVKFIRDGARYDLGSVLLKKNRGLCDLLLWRRPKIRPVCMIEDLLASVTDIPSHVSSAIKRATDIDIGDARHIFDGSDISKRGGVKRVYLSLGKLKRQNLEKIDLIAGNIVDLFSADMSGFDVEDFYVIKEVIYTQELCVKVTLGERVLSFNRDIRWPIAFKLCKFQLLYDSVLGQMDIVTNDLKVRWRHYKRYHMVRTLFIGDIERGFGDDMMREQRRRFRERARRFVEGHLPELADELAEEFAEMMIG